MNIGESVTKNYTGAVQTFVVPNSGLYQIECWGAKGGDLNISTVGNYRGGNGGYAKGIAKLRRGQTVYIYVGGTNGFNGGGTGGHYRYDDGAGAWTWGGIGGGASHVAVADYGQLPNYSSHQNDVLIVAGGGGGAFVYDAPAEGYGDWGVNGGIGGNQSASGSFGQGANWNISSYGGSGAGWKGGTGGSGGSSYTSPNMTDTVLTSGVNGGNGSVKLTLLKKTGIKYGTYDCYPVFGEKDIVAIKLGDMDIG